MQKYFFFPRHWSGLKRKSTKLAISCIVTKDVIARYELHTEDVEKGDQQPPPELQLEINECMRLNKELADKILELGRMEGQDLEELNIDELQRLENRIEGGLSRVLQTKDKRIMSQILALEKKGAELTEANNQLRQRLGMLSNGDGNRAGGVALESEISTDEEEGMASEFVVGCYSTGSSTSSLDDDSSDNPLIIS
ncbi:putative transcription factor, K-box [Rosa chinensis]|uniref:Putative transcription factor, K-box n=1 Tax=Rosa chinensis TaxID=74649 RepID=A0A2P6P8U2_ROSCH|nr:putative transcription factor, K-box [Rosa chinensis]